MAFGAKVRIAGVTHDTGPVSILFRKRGEANFQVRRQLSPDADGHFATTYTALNDYRYYAAGDNCDSSRALTQVSPVLSGPAVVRRGSTVTLTVRAPAGSDVRVFFHRAGHPGYAPRRFGVTDVNGLYTTSFTASDDYRYFASVGPEPRRLSNLGLTQVR